jgi:hypothetical protein
MAPPGTRIIAHETPSKMRTWDPHGQDGWYIGPDLEHYRCYTVYITKTRGDKIVETIDFSPEKFTLPFPSPQCLATKAAVDLTHALLHPQPAGPFCKVGDAKTIALKRLADIFEGATRQKIESCGFPHQKRRQQFSSEGANRTFTSEGGKHNRTTNVSPAKHISTLNTTFPSTTNNTCQTCSHTTNTACHGATQCWTAI